LKPVQFSTGTKAMTETTKKHGGKREGSGAKPKAPTTAIRIDNRLIELVSVIKSSYTNGIIDDACINKLIANNLNFVQDSTPDLKISRGKLEQHQDKLMGALTKHYGNRDTAKIQLATQLGIEPKHLVIRKLSLAEIVDIWEWFNETHT
jgi:hypothetical protein